MDRPRPIVEDGCGGAQGGLRWSWGAEQIDRLLPQAGLELAAVHEIKPSAPADAPAARVLALLLALRLGRARAGPTLWVQPAHDAHESGRPYGPGLLDVGLDPTDLLLVRPASAAQTLWAIEEGLKSRAVGLVIGTAGAMTPLAQRRLSLAAAATHTPCLLITPHAAPGLTVARTRWRVARPSARGTERNDQRRGDLSSERPAHRQAPPSTGLRLLLTLERCRPTGADGARESGGEGRVFEVEWADEAHRFRLSAAMADRAAGADATAGRTRGSSARAG